MTTPDHHTNGQSRVRKLTFPGVATVLMLLATGLGDQAIARRLGYRERTVQRMTTATGAKTRCQADLRLGRRNWIV
jgi:DNA-binding NarL/FixJ family response regulator